MPIPHHDTMTSDSLILSGIALGGVSSEAELLVFSTCRLNMAGGVFLNCHAVILRYSCGEAQKRITVKPGAKLSVQMNHHRVAFEGYSEGINKKSNKTMPTRGALFCVEQGFFLPSINDVIATFGSAGMPSNF